MNPQSYIDPPNHSYVITPDDSNALPRQVRSIYVGGAGNLAVINGGDSASVVYFSLNAGTRLSGMFTKVLATNTTCTNLIGEY